MASVARVIEAHDPLEDWSLPGWLYHDPEYHAVEMARVIRPAWQVVCHASDIAGPGDWRTLELLGESVLAVRGADGVVRAFLNTCRHRGSRVVDGEAGCARKLVCPYHAWTYELDGRLSGVPGRESYANFDLGALGLVPVEVELWRGFVFVRLQRVRPAPSALRGGGEADGGGRPGHDPANVYPSVAAMMAEHDAEIAPYRFEDMRMIGRVTMRPRPVNWKNVGDNYSDALHIPVAHPGLTRLLGRSYGVQAGAYVDKMWGRIVDQPSANPSERAYQAMLPRVPNLTDEHQRLWLYLKLWPNTAFDIYPDQIDFMQFLPLSPTMTMVREISYAVPDGRREMRAARYLNWRINRQVNAEDTVLIERVQAGMQSPGYRPGPLGRSEVALRSFARKLRDLIPETREAHPPKPGWSARASG